MGNIKYKGKVIDNLDATDIPDHSNVERVAAILGVDKHKIVSALTSKTIVAQVGVSIFVFEANFVLNVIKNAQIETKKAFDRQAGNFPMSALSISQSSDPIIFSFSFISLFIT